MERSYYPPFWLRFLITGLVALIVSEYGSMDGLAVRVHTMEFYVEFGSTLLIAVLTVELLYHFHLWLEARYPWKVSPVSRLFLQVGLGLVVPAILVFALASIYFRAFGVSIYETNYLAYAFPFIVALIFLANVVLIGLPYFLLGVGLIKQDSYRHTIPIDGNGEFPVSAIAWISILNDVVFVGDFDGNEYICQNTLDQIEGWLNPDIFCRANRQLIANKEACNGYVSAEYGKLNLQMEPLPPVSTTVSQRKAPMVRRWFSS